MTKAEALAYVEQGEYYRERARIEAGNLLDEIPVEELLQDPAGAAGHILDLAVLVLSPIAFDAASDAQKHALTLGLTEVTDEEAAQAVDEAISHLDTIQQEIADRIQTADENIRRDGAALATITAVLASAAGRTAFLSPVLGLLQGAMAGVVTLVEQNVMDLAQAKTVQQTPETLFRWRATGDGRSCNDIVEDSCEPRDGMVKTFDAWQEIGLPGASHLLCSVYSRSGLPQCRCTLENATLPHTEPGVLDITDAVKAGRDRARQ